MNNNTIITALKDKQELFIQRVFDAPIEKVYNAFSTPATLVKFFAPTGMKMEFLDSDYRQGCFYRYRHTDSKGNTVCTFKGIVHEMTAPGRIIITSEMEELQEGGHVVLETYEFFQIEGNKTKLLIHDVCRSVEDRDAMIKSGMESGVINIFENLDKLLKEENETCNNRTIH